MFFHLLLSIKKIMFNHAFIQYSLIKILYFTISKKEIKEIFKVI